MLAEVKDLKCKSEKDIEEARVRLLGKKGEITRLFDEFRTVAPEMKREFGQKLNVLKKEALARIEELKANVAASGAASFEQRRLGPHFVIGLEPSSAIGLSKLTNEKSADLMTLHRLSGKTSENLFSSICFASLATGAKSPATRTFILSFNNRFEI